MSKRIPITRKSPRLAATTAPARDEVVVAVVEVVQASVEMRVPYRGVVRHQEEVPNRGVVSPC